MDWTSPVSCFFKGFKSVGPMQQNMLFWNSEWRDGSSPSKVVKDSFRMSSSSVRLFEDQISGIPLLWIAPRSGNNLFTTRNLQSLLYVAHLQPSFPSSYHWFCFSSGDFDFLHVLGNFHIYIYEFIYLFICPGSGGVVKRCKLCSEEKLPTCKLKAVLGYQGKGEENCLTIKLPSSARSPPHPTRCTLLSCT